MPFTNVPPTLPKTIATHITRANQLEKADPLMSYFNALYAVEQVLNEDLHTSDESISKFAIELLDYVEAFKADEANAANAEIAGDKLTSIAYVVNFTNKIFNNALKQIQNHTSNKSTALNLLSTTNFYSLLKLWESDEELYNSVNENEEISKKIKYAKFHAARIIKTIKKGEDPNEYDPPELDLKAPEHEDEEDLPSPVSESSVALPGVSNPSPKTGSPTSEQEGPETDELGLPSAPKSFKSSKAEEKENFTLPSTPSFKPDPPKTEPEPLRSEWKAPKKEINVNEYLISSEIYTKAQKHAKFAISAMNYEDKETALKELQNAIDLISKLEA